MAKATTPKSKKRGAEASAAAEESPVETTAQAPAESEAVTGSANPAAGGSDASEEGGGKYTWALLSSRIAPSSEEDLQLFGIRRPGDLLRLDGREVSSDKILTDGRRWAGQLLEFSDSGAEVVAKVFGFRLGLLRTFHTELVKLRTLVARRESAKEDSTVAQAQAVALANDLSHSLRPRYAQRRAALIAAAANDASALARVLALPPSEMAEDKLPGAVRDLSERILALVDRGDAVGARTRTRGFSPADAEALVQLANQLEDAIELRDAPDRLGPVDSRTLDTQDGICLALMEQLLDLFDGAQGQAGVPKLQPNATRGWFNRRSKQSKEAAAKHSSNDR